MAVEKLRDLLRIVLRHEELARGDIQERNAIAASMTTKRREPVVVAPVDHLVAVGHPRGDHFGDTALHDGLREFGILQLVTDRDTETRPDQSGQVGLQRMMWKTGQFGLLVATVVPFGEGDPQDPRGRYRVAAECLVEVAHTEKQHRIGVLSLDACVLPHQGCFAGRRLRHVSPFFQRYFRGRTR